MDSLISKQSETHEMSVTSKHDVSTPNQGDGVPVPTTPTGRLVSIYDRQINKLKDEIINLRSEGAGIQAEIESMAYQMPTEETGGFKVPDDEMLAEIQLTRDKLDSCLDKNKALERLHVELVKANEELANALELGMKAWRRS